MPESPMNLDAFSTVVSRDVSSDYFDGQQTRPLNAEEVDWINKGIKAAQWLLVHYQISADGGGSLQMLDDVLDRWRADRSPERPDGEFVSTAIGCLFGYCFVQELGGVFVVVTDKHGVDLGVETAPGEIGFPIDSVLKRLDRADATLSELLATIRKHHDSL